MTSKPSPPPPSIGDLTNQLKQLTKEITDSKAGKELRLSEASRKKYKTLIGNYRKELQELSHKAAKLVHYGNPGLLHSATQTRSNFTDALTPNAAKSLDHYIAYLEELERAVEAAHNRMLADDAST